MRICKNCGVEYEEGSAFCRNCGCRIEASAVKTHTQTPEVQTPETSKPENINPIELQPEITDKTNTEPVLDELKPVQITPEKNKPALVPIILAALAVVVVGAIVLVPKLLPVEPKRDYFEYGDQQEQNERQKDEDEQEEEEKESSYTVYASDATWYEASQNALKRGGYLVSINDSDEFEKVCALADEKNLKVFWVGAKRSKSQNWDDTEWADGKKLTYTYWYDGEPTYYSEDGDEELHLMVFNVNGTWYYNDAINDVSKYYAGKMGYIVETKE